MAKPKTKPQQAPKLDDAPLFGKSEGGEFGGDADDEDEDDEDDEDEEAAEKSQILEHDLLKSLDALDTLATAAANGQSPRQAALAAKLAAEGTLTKSESDELRSFLASEERLEKSHMEAFVSDPNVQQGFEVSDFLDAFGKKTAEAFDDLRSEIRKSFGEVGEFHAVFAKSMSAVGALIAAQNKRIEQLEGLVKSGAPADVVEDEPAPARAASRPSAVGTRVSDDGIRKSEGGGGGEPLQLSRPQILETLDDIVEKSEGKKGMVDGVDIVNEAARYETTGLLSKSAMRLVCKQRGIDPAQLGI